MSCIRLGQTASVAVKRASSHIRFAAVGRVARPEKGIPKWVSAARQHNDKGMANQRSADCQKIPGFAMAKPSATELRVPQPRHSPPPDDQHLDNRHINLAGVARVSAPLFRH
jgi:hypothetical protein